MKLDEIENYSKALTLIDEIFSRMTNMSGASFTSVMVKNSKDISKLWTELSSVLSKMDNSDDIMAVRHRLLKRLR